MIDNYSFSIKQKGVSKREDRIVRTSLGFQDITEALKIGFYEICQYDVIKKVFIKSVRRNLQTYGRYWGKEIGIGNFYIKEYHLGGRVFPMDEIIEPEREYDLIVQKVRGQQADTQIYHDFNTGERIKVKVYDYAFTGGEPSLKMFNRITGFVKQQSPKINREIEIGDTLLIEVLKSFKSRTKMGFEAKALEFLV